MRNLKLFFLLVTLLITGCATSIKKGDYILRVIAINADQVEVSGLLSLSPFVSWRDTRYGDPPDLLIQKLIRSEFGKSGIIVLSIRNFKTTTYESGNYLGYSAIVLVVEGGPLMNIGEIRGNFVLEPQPQPEPRPEKGPDEG